MHTHETKYSSQKIWRGADRHQRWRCAFDGQPTKALRIIPLLRDIGHSLLIVRENSNFWTDRCTLMEQSLSDRVDGEELIDTKVGGVHSTDSWWHPSQVYPSHMVLIQSLLIIPENSNYLMYGFMEQTLSDRGYVEELIDTNAWGVHSTDSRQKLSKLCL